MFDSNCNNTALDSVFFNWPPLIIRCTIQILVAYNMLCRYYPRGNVN